MKKYNVYLNGEWLEGEQQIQVLNPATGEVFAEVASVGRDAAKKAIDDAHEAFDQWKILTAKERGNYLKAIASALESRADEMAEIITMENGKPLTQAKGEVAMTVDHLLWFAEEGRRAYGRVVPQQMDGKRHMVIKQPVGVVGAIAPWNFPLVLAIRKVAPALVAGCPVLLKPASATPLSACLFAECVEEAGVPKGVFQVVVGNASEIGNEMLENPLCRKISFTGSTEVGRKLIAGAARTCTELSLELGGNAPLIVFEDADFEQALEGIMIAKFRNNGQSCIAANRIYIQRPVFEKYKDALVERISSLKVGEGLEDAVEIGPLVDEQALSQVLEMIDEAVRGGAIVLAGGKRLGDQGAFLAPTLLIDVPDGALCRQEEIFAPAAVLYPFDNEEEVIRAANDTEFGLAAYVFTTDLNRAFRVSEALEAGTVGVNDPAPSTSNCPFGGFKQSGWGRELGREGIEAYQETKHISLGGVF
ncbi:NAD-dependent succinate-semialdehyde dehydrogenase [Desulfosediminicola ganghwensis]|uniref:NAD-dependent succinate-semialdehyde dehydrogenase n=1 Tax=Desulfosediminicola ganghwensis TaxID=2569540 RepID=UPI0010AC865B|nr:NAD-dependent succinate-semialdehyde dehydrogenase [Desulfosediminicola ganghwensis]